MDCIKNVIAIALVIGLLGMATGQSIYITDEDYGAVDVNHEEEKFITATTPLDDGEYTYLFAKGTSILNYENLIIKAIDNDSAHGSNTQLTFDCSGYNESNDWNISNDKLWQDQGYSIYQLPVLFRSTSDYAGFTFDRDMVWIIMCNVSVSGDDIYLQSYISPRSSRYVEEDFPTPSQPLSDLVGTDRNAGMRGILNIGFDIFAILIMITALVVLMYIFVMLWKLFEFFADKVKNAI